MAGANAHFKAAKFREGIRKAMTMGEPPKVSEQITFHFAEQVSFVGAADGDSVPFDPAENVTRHAPPPIHKTCTVEFVRPPDEPTAFGVILPARLKVTLLDEDYEAVKNATYVEIGQDKYRRHYMAPAIGLFDVGMYELVFVAENER